MPARGDIAESFIRRSLRAAVAIALLLGLTACPAPPPPPPPPQVLTVDRVLVLKAARQIELLHGDTVLKTYPIALGRNPLGPKRKNGDGRTPEGVYVVDGRNDRSQYYRALHISYPDAADRARAAAAHVDPGGEIFIHGLPNSYRGSKNPSRFYVDWTDGCIAVGDAAMDELWTQIADGTPIEIRP